MENHCLNFFQIFICPNQSPIKRLHFVAGLDVTLNRETAIKLCVSKAHLNAQACVENGGYGSLFMSLPFSSPFPAPHAFPPVDTN